MRKDVVGVDANSNDPDQPGEIYTPQPLYNTVVGVHNINRVNRVISKQNCVDYIEKWPFMVIFQYNLYIFLSIFEPCYIQNHVITDRVIQVVMYSDQKLCNTSLCSAEPNDSISGQWLSWSDCVDAQADLGLRCPHMTEGTFSHGMAHVMLVALHRTCLVLAHLRKLRISPVQHFSCHVRESL